MNRRSLTLQYPVNVNLIEPGILIAFLHCVPIVCPSVLWLIESMHAAPTSLYVFFVIQRK